MKHAEIEQTYEILANKVDEIGEKNSELYLAKLVLLLAHHNGNPEEVLQMIDDAAFGLAEAKKRARSIYLPEN